MTDSFSKPTNSVARSMLKTADIFEAIILKVSAVCCWSSALLIAVIILNVTMRYGFNNGLILFEEIQWHLYAIGIMFGLSYAEITNSQVRVDVVASMLKPKTVLKWEIFGAVFFIFPTIFVILFNSFDYVANSYMLGESSSSPLGMPFRWAIKAAIPASFILLAMAVLARMFRNIITITQKET
ncbi:MULTISPECIES: TRAP transporter small permease subunit [Colwellia]|uniref:TRAP transporter small permease protein n=2 Tax=Colwellia TaxID=28228 RepID=A0A5C6QL63_9GAMM|nr:MULTISPECIES: TRAP transporter small permease subunit [Colwellia]AAZ25243.1 C4-dicarboxylate transporter family protein, DctQ subunit [Colwellia psychrerythraea 34H]PKH89242.1 C4-dicarboxylate ABC transporter [Colwellia sp. Bg11-28]TWX69715.1 TRAP transporter small permease subunit [Colwellia demingiae]